MKKILLMCLITTVLSGCATIDTIKKYWPRDHDPVMFNQLVALDRMVELINCENPDWILLEGSSAQLSRYTEWRHDPQAENIKGLHSHIQRMSKGGSKTFCEIGKKTAGQRIQAARSAWEKR